MLTKMTSQGEVVLSAEEETAMRAEWAVNTAEELAREAESARLAADRESARQYTKLLALAEMSPAEIQTWIDANVTNLATAQDAIKTMAIGLSILIRRELKQ